MNLRITPRIVSYRVRGEPKKRVRLHFHVDGTNVGSILLEESIAHEFILGLIRGHSENFSISIEEE